MTDYTIGESYTLPSLGKVYNQPVNPEVKIRSMTTEEEMRRLASVDHPYKNMSEIIDACLLNDPGISSFDMCIGDYQFLLHKLRVVTYGPDYAVTNKCIYCGSDSQDTINLEELPVLQYTDEFEQYKEFDLPRSKKHIKLQVQTPRSLEVINEQVKNFKRKAKSSESAGDPTLVYTVMSLIDEIDFKKPDPTKLELWVRSLPMADTNCIIQHADKMNELIGLDTRLTCTCDICGLSFHTGLKITPEFFRPALGL